ncbi:cobalamin biosynthesis protein [Actinoalloteichus hymeniacidonis]|uniref:Cobalamin biosynthesis protein CobD n=1 Tax=Actinoalloteichus hymeniacidonis TaxID=340345 RepID=A0AAC9N0A0_9PSEU|nr:cobalamin biosynthesis protein [Actinoalloteichus hymeniacidonis]AOS65205.1 cobalamin biosynthesis protein CobD [Actinoalloteichus hymeniacidonis]MBB5906715.1 adenosylcobinamide-phosphate synthase [Actinoalloteichus hymeniacidonis]
MSAGRAVGLLLGVAADAAFGDPRRGHPVAGFGRVATAVEHRIYRDHRAAGAAFTGLLVGGGVAVGLAAQRLARVSPIAEAATTALATWMVLGGASLAEEGTTMARALDSGEIDEARESLPRLCGRNPGSLDGPGLARASVESIAENTSDAVVAPLLWGAVAGVPGLLGYRAVNTLDAMVGHRSPRYRQFGWASARLDDLANLVPSRATAMLTSLCAPVVGGSAQGAWRTWRRDAAAHPSPNAGQVEAAFAGALEVRLGGRTVYHHGTEERPMLGDGRTPDAGDVTRGVELSRVIGAVAGVVSAAAAVAIGQRVGRGSRRRRLLRNGGTQG